MSDVDCWVYFEGPEPASLKPFFDALRGGDAPRATPEHKAQSLADFLVRLDQKLALRGTEPHEQPDEQPDGDPAPPESANHPTHRSESTGDGAHPGPGDGAGDEGAMDFEAWAALSVRFLGKTDDEQRETLREHGLTGDDWTRIDDHHFGALSADSSPGSTERQAIYEAKCDEEMARRASLSEPAEQARPTPPMPMPAYVPAPAAVKVTGDMDELTAAVQQAMGKLPFKPASELTRTPAKDSARTMKVQAVPSIGGTFSVEGNAFQKAVASVPFAGSEAATTVVYFPNLTVERYVSLHGDLARTQEPRAKTLALYGVPHEASLQALDQHWRERLARTPELSLAMAAAGAKYTAWLATLPR